MGTFFGPRRNFRQFFFFRGSSIFSFVSSQPLILNKIDLFIQFYHHIEKTCFIFDRPTK
jgi:hypothetical protein